MGRTAKLAAAAAFGGTFAAIAIVTATRPAAPPAIAVLTAAPEAMPPTHDDALKRCRSVSVADAECDAAWEAERRRFFQTQDR